VSGLIAVLGGQEHHPGCEPIDRRLLAECGLSNPTVTILLAATVPNRIGAKVLEITNYWPGLGARVRISCLGGVHDTEQTLEALRDTDLVVLAGGRPWLMRARLTNLIIERLWQLSDEGVPLSGSSAGAMALCAWRLHLQPGRSPRVERGLGFVPGFAAPHYGRHGTQHAWRVIAHHHPHMEVLGLQDRTALIGRDGHYQIMGAGSCTILRGGTSRRYPSGARVRLCGTPLPAPVVDSEFSWELDVSDDASRLASATTP
jgi:cyanophycinase-like exopeptidase